MGGADRAECALLSDAVTGKSGASEKNFSLLIHGSGVSALCRDDWPESKWEISAIPSENAVICEAADVACSLHKS
jgi:hypothetical protein